MSVSNQAKYPFVLHVMGDDIDPEDSCRRVSFVGRRIGCRSKKEAFSEAEAIVSRQFTDVIVVDQDGNHVRSFSSVDYQDTYPDESYW